jgi:hypothetical protein
MRRPRGYFSAKSAWRNEMQLAGLLAMLAALVHPAAAQEPVIQRQRPDTKVNRLIEQLESTHPFQDPWASVLQEIAEVGTEAVPDLIAELDATDNDIMLRNMSFLLRAIGDKRAVPALIRALPRTCRQPGSDMGCRAMDKKLLAFLQKHDLDENNEPGEYGYGRPIREISGALQKLTGTKHGEEQLYGVFLAGGVQQQLAQRKLYYRCAERWTEWWEANWRKHVEDEIYATVDLPPGDDAPTVEFPHGPDFRQGSGMSGNIIESERAAKARHVFYDLDTGRGLPLPEQFRELPDDAARRDAIEAWAADEGFDLMGTEFTPAGDTKSHYAIRTLGLSAWQVADERWGTFAAEVPQVEPLKLGRPAAGLLLRHDDKTKQISPTEPAVFLFRTREGAFGILRVGLEVHDTDMSERIGKPVMGDIDLDPVGFYKGRRMSYHLIEG